MIMWFTIFLLSALSTTVLAIWPAPQSFTSGTSVLWIAPNVHVTYNGASVRSSSFSYDFYTGTEEVLGVQLQNSHVTRNADSFSSQAIVDGAVSRALQTLFTQNIVPWKLVARNQLAEFEPAANSQKTYITTLAITQSGTENSTTFKPLSGQVDESYSLKVGTDGTASITAVSSTGVLHALQTFIQLFYQHSTGAGMYTKLAPISIADAPKFTHRGLNLDVSRNWYPVTDILRTIDALSWNKFNILHIHMTDSQSWPMDIPALPLLSQNGAYQTGLSYKPSDIQLIQTFAIQRGINVIIEFDMPGHTTAIGLAYPNLIAAFDAKPWATYCAEPPCGTLQLNNPDVYTFLESLFNDVLPRVQKYTAYFHTGGDEVNAEAYTLDPTVKSNDTHVIAGYIQKLVDYNHARVRAAGLVPIVWEEMLLNWNLTLGDDVVVQSWLSDDSVAAIVKQGHKVLAGNYNFWYLDCGKGQWLDFDNGASFQQFYPFNDYCSPVKNWRLVYSYDPLSGVPADLHHLVLGGEVHMWSEQTDAVNLDDMVWPRASAAGEVLWSGRQDSSGQNRSQITASPRLAEMRERMVNRGVRAGPVQMIFCTQANATECSL